MQVEENEWNGVGTYDSKSSTTLDPTEEFLEFGMFFGHAAGGEDFDSLFLDELGRGGKSYRIRMTGSRETYSFIRSFHLISWLPITLTLTCTLALAWP